MQLKNFVDLSEIERVLVYAWRNHIKVAPQMKKQSVTLREHYAFIESLKQDSTKRYFLVVENQEILGVVCFVDIEFGASCEFGIYQNPDLKRQGGILMHAILQYAFETLQVATLHACAFNDNTKAIALYSKFGFHLSKKDETMSYFELSRGGGI